MMSHILLHMASDQRQLCKCTASSDPLHTHMHLLTLWLGQGFLPPCLSFLCQQPKLHVPANSTVRDFSPSCDHILSVSHTKCLYLDTPVHLHIVNTLRTSPCNERSQCLLSFLPAEVPTKEG